MAPYYRMFDSDNLEQNAMNKDYDFSSCADWFCNKVSKGIITQDDFDAALVVLLNAWNVKNDARSAMVNARKAKP